MSSIEYAHLYNLPDELWFCGTYSLPQFSESFFESSISSTNTDMPTDSIFTMMSEPLYMIDQGSHSNMCACLNSRSLKNKMAEFNALMSSMKLSIVAVTETWLDSFIPSSIILTLTVPNPPI